MSKKNNRLLLIVAGFFLLLVLQLVLSVSSQAIDNPHNSISTTQCISCHDEAKSAATSTWWSDQESNVCGQCHNSTGATGADVVTHKKDGGIILVTCTECHDPHNQMQNRTWTTLSYLESGTSSTTAGSITATTLKKSGAANWTPNQWAGMLLVPNVRYQAFSYRIASNTADTITISTGPQGLDAINLTYARPGNTFAIAWGKLIKENVRGMNVKFFRETGANSFADGDATIDGICQVCHTSTKYFTKTGVLDQGGHPAAAGVKCVQCHDHKEGFKASCSTCHGKPPVDAATMVSSNGSTAGTTGSTTAGAHEKHAASTGLNYDCNYCHYNSSGAGTTHNNSWTITMGFSGLARNGVPGTSTYNGQPLPVSYNTSNATTAVTNNGTRSCSNVYCHSTVQADGGAGAPSYKAPVWDDLGGVVCGSCHDTTAPLISTGSHTVHLNVSSINCESCHTGAGDGTSYAASNHVNYNIEVSNSYPSINPPGNGYGQCSTSACHSNGRGIYATPTWGGTSPGCTFCHPVLSGRHANHVLFTNSSPYGNTSANYSGSATDYDFGCGNCHPTAIANHMNGVVDISLSPADGGTLKSKNSSPTVSGSGNTTQCSGVYCHSDGKAAPVFVLTPQWGGSFADASNTCGQCHGNSPATGAHALHAVGIHFEDVYSGSSGKTAATGGAGSGAAHGDPAVSTTISCNICHATTLSKSRNKFGSACNGCHNGDAASTAIVSVDLSKTTHLNGAPNVSFATIQIKSRSQLRNDITTVAELNTYWQRVNNYKAGVTSYDQSKGTLAATAGYAGGSCSAVACHNGKSASWIGTLSCNGCHEQLAQ